MVDPHGADGAEPAAAENEHVDLSLESALDQTLAAGAPGEALTVGDILAGLEQRSYGPLLFIPSLIAVVPFIGMIPGVSWAMAAIILLVSLQLFFARRKVWVPRRLRDAPVSRDLLARGLSFARPSVRRIDVWTEPQLLFLVRGPLVRLIAVVCFAMAIVMYAVSFFPGGVVPPALVVCLFAVALTTQDGRIALAGYAGAGGAVYAATFMV